MALKIILDAGHGGYDFGATYNERIEKDDNLRIVLALGEILKNNGVNVAYTRNDDAYLNPNERADIVNESAADLLIQIHRNFSPYPNTYSGVETLIYKEGDVEEGLGYNINSRLENVGFHNLGVNKRANLIILRKSKIPAALVEVGFLNTEEDNQLYDSNLNEVANAIAMGIFDTVGYQKKKPPFYYRLQLGLYENYEDALNIQSLLAEEGYVPEIITMGNNYATIIGKFFSIEQAGKMRGELKRKGYETLVIAL